MNNTEMTQKERAIILNELNEMIVRSAEIIDNYTPSERLDEINQKMITRHITVPH